MERKYFGSNAVEALYTKRNKDIIKAYVTEATTKKYGVLLKWCAKNKKAYHIVSEKDLEKISETTHHEGICVIANERKELIATEALEDIGESEIMVFLDDVANPHNVGAIIRSCAHFGVRYVIARKSAAVRLSGVVARIAEGGAEAVTLVRVPNDAGLAMFAKKAKAMLIGTNVEKGISLYARIMSKRAILIVGNEAEGVSPELLKAADCIFKIPGSGEVESLNVATATGVILGEYWRQHRS